MSERVRLGKAYIELPQGGLTPIDPYPKRQEIRAEKPEMPEQLEETPYIYRPNDPFQSPIDEARAIGSISTAHKPWVRKAWFVLFILGPLVYAELNALAAAFNAEEAGRWAAFLGTNALILPIWGVYFAIWRRKVKGGRQPASNTLSARKG